MEKATQKNRIVLYVALLLIFAASTPTAQGVEGNYIVAFEHLQIKKKNETFRDERFAVFVGFRFHFGVPNTLQVFSHPITRGRFVVTVLRFNDMQTPETPILPPEFLGTIVLFMEQDYSNGLEMASGLQQTIVDVLENRKDEPCNDLSDLTDFALLSMEPERRRKCINDVKKNIETDLGRELESTYRRIKKGWRDEDDIVGLAFVLYSSRCGEIEVDPIPSDCHPALLLNVHHVRDVEGKYRTYGKICQSINPTQLSPANKTVFDHYPRETTLNWKAVPCAMSYTVEIQYKIGDRWLPLANPSGIKTTSYTFRFLGAQPGRWRVWAVGLDGQEGPKSDWWEFSYTR